MRQRLEAVVVESLPNSSFRVKLEDGRTAVVHASGRVRTDVVRIIPGERVRVEISPFDPGRGRIVEHVR